jgi:hypothetical protein
MGAETKGSQALAFSDDASAPTWDNPAPTIVLDASIREAFVAFIPVTITGGGNHARGENGYWNGSKMVLLSELAAHLESGRLLRIINTPMGQELISEPNSFEADFTSAAKMRHPRAVNV